MEIAIRNCAFKFRCDQDWGDLERTSEDKVRFCHKCEEDVHYVHTNKELKKAIEKNYCVALVVARNDDYSGVELGKVMHVD